MNFLSKLFLCIASIILLFLVFSVGSNAQENTAVFKIYPESETVVAGNSLKITAKVDSKGSKINVVQFNLYYPDQKVSKITINTEESIFKVKAQEIATDGIIKIARGSTSPISGEQIVATITLEVKEDLSIYELVPSKGMAIIRWGDSINIYGSTEVEKSSEASVEAVNPVRSAVRNAVDSIENALDKFIFQREETDGTSEDLSYSREDKSSYTRIIWIIWGVVLVVFVLGMVAYFKNKE